MLGKRILFILIIGLLLIQKTLLAVETNEENSRSPLNKPGELIEYQPKQTREFRHVIREDISGSERLITFGLIYTVQWGSYLISQWETLHEHGSFKNWYTNMYQPHFDRDSYDYNLIYHTITGAYYFLFFRSRGYTKGASLMWSFLAQFLFEFTVETATEQPSFQDLYQTPVLGAIIGMILESASNALLSTDYVAAHVLGYILNPFAILPFSSYEVSGGVQVSNNTIGYGITFRFNIEEF
ncbi:MAG: DUF3943 domain-containing protein [bacterium]|nr:DUF3943 domain-containing protein [bacterium]